MNDWTDKIINIAFATLIFVAVIGLILVFGGLVVFGHTRAHAHEHTAGESPEQARIIAYYKTWKRPKGEFAVPHREYSCCYGDGAQQDCFPVLQERINAKGIREVMPDVTGTHTRAQAEYGNRWYPLVHGIEEDRQIDPRESPDGRSHVCISNEAAICYVPGYGG